MEFFRDPFFCSLYRQEIRIIVNISQIIRDLESILFQCALITEAIGHYRRLRQEMMISVQNCYLVYCDMALQRA